MLYKLKGLLDYTQLQMYFCPEKFKIIIENEKFIGFIYGTNDGVGAA